MKTNADTPRLETHLPDRRGHISRSPPTAQGSPTRSKPRDGKNQSPRGAPKQGAAAEDKKLLSKEQLDKLLSWVDPTGKLESDVEEVGSCSAFAIWKKQ